MANPHKGAVEFEADGKSYKLSFSADAMCELEEAFDRNTDALIAMLRAGDELRLKDLRVFFWKGMEDYQPGTSFDEARTILKRVKAADMGTLIAKAFLLSMPAAETPTETEKNPPKAVPKDGTGAASSKNGVPSD